MKIVSWNVNGLRAAISKGFHSWLESEEPDIVCLQETKISKDQIELNLSGYHEYYSFAEKRGYSGTAIYTKIEPISFKEGIGDDIADREGRCITLEFDKFYLVCVYVPNSKRELLRLEYRREFNKAFEEYLASLDKIKPVVVTGDFNVAHKEIDIKNPKSNLRSAGFTIEEREDFSRLLERGFTDSFRSLHPDSIKYSWWSYMFKSREKNIGWRIDYFLVSNRFMQKVVNADILTDVLGSDHCPVLLELDS